MTYSLAIIEQSGSIVQTWFSATPWQRDKEGAFHGTYGENNRITLHIASHMTIELRREEQ